MTDLNPGYTFDTFVIGANNRLAVTAAKAVTKNPGRVHNPLFVYGDTGLGKTHLLTAIGHAVGTNHPDFSVRYLTLDDFVEQYHHAVAQGDADAFREQYRAAHVILIDDVQFLAHRQELQSELLRFAVDLQEHGIQIVFTSDRPPHELAPMDERLFTQLESGFSADVSAPDFDTRLAILHQRAEHRGTDIGEELLRVVAESDARNVRELLGMLNRLMAVQAVSEDPITPEAARKLFEGGDDSLDESGALDVSDDSTDESPDEFGAFLTDITATVSQRVGGWQSRLMEAIDRWAHKGYNTVRLDRLVDAGIPCDATTAVREFEVVISRLRQLQNDIADCDPEMAGDPVFRDPERFDEAEALVRQAQEKFEPPPGPSDSFSMDDFIGSDSTKMALGAVESVIAEPGSKYNPLVIVGPSGVGKTHLLHAVGHAIQDAHGGWVACVSAQVFMDELITAIEGNRVPSWRARYRRSSAFLLDNVDLIAAKDRMQDEIFFLFNVLFDANRQLVFTSSVRPREVKGLDDQLTSRLESGLVASLDPPDRALRRAIIARQLEFRVGEVEDELADFLADQRAESVRSVLALGQRVITSAEARGGTPNIEIAREVVGASAVRESGASRRRTSGVVLSPSGGVHSREKMVWDWPDPVERVIEEMR